MYSSIAGKVASTVAGLKRVKPELVPLFEQCYSNTLETTIERLGDSTTFMITGDIPAMWLRDSSAQVRPYIQLAAQDAELAGMIRGLIMRQAGYLLLDPYANAFNKEGNGAGHQQDITRMGPWIWERKYELDSLCYPVQLLQDYWSATGDDSIFDETIHSMLQAIVATMRTEQHHDEQSEYSFERLEVTLPSDTLPFDGRGTRTNFTGMVWSGFRPSDDACQFGYLIPANMFAAVILKHVAHYADLFYKDGELAAAAGKLGREIEFGIENYGVYRHPVFGEIYAYETDGYGNYNLMDDANVPSLLSIPYLGYRDLHDPMYQRTRSFVLSTENPYYFAGRYARGIGSPHTPYGYIWHIGLIMQGLTANDLEEKEELLRQLAATTGGTQLMHESFDPDRPEEYTREWFGWANSLFGLFVTEWLESL
ncbi:glycoside hydrolase family 125 protein [Paenibacillus sp. S150]|uniref:glycoside hydrolase family 125 protein n=1 Tax=Paenibacillus sp. S150 TaxID=2749826 RepID=UPI001C55A3CF|nr:glycoside hydrolase family 125 protein [Paenibacillus sp. S150]MBW4079834.1 glycoside hydrolase family 125 protein [Paenibacillus sp. S150]